MMMSAGRTSYMAGDKEMGPLSNLPDIVNTWQRAGTAPLPSSLNHCRVIRLASYIGPALRIAWFNWCEVSVKRAVVEPAKATTPNVTSK